MSILINRPGMLTTIQDLGRHGFRALGINPGGAMDPYAVRLINTILGNDENDATLEMHFPAPEIVFETEAVFALGGAEFAPYLNDVPLENWRPFTAGPDSILYFKNKLAGNRCYLAIQGGIKSDRWLGSSSTNLRAVRGGFAGRRLEAGDRLELVSKSPARTPIDKAISPFTVPSYSDSPTLRVVPGAEIGLMLKPTEEIFFNHTFTISAQSDRMGFRLSGEPIELTDHGESISSAVSFGTIQALPDGQLIILMADHQTTGGYPRIAHIISRDLPIIGQLGPGDTVRFQKVTIAEAEKLDLESRRHLKFLRVGSKFESIST